jgi:hypothetical protein
VRPSLITLAFLFVLLGASLRTGRAVAAAPPLPAGSTDAQIFSSIAQGRAHGIPTWRHTLTNDQIWKLVAYIKSMRTRNESQPPSNP